MIKNFVITLVGRLLKKVLSHINRYPKLKIAILNGMKKALGYKIYSKIFSSLKSMVNRRSDFSEINNNQDDYLFKYEFSKSAFDTSVVGETKFIKLCKSPQGSLCFVDKYTHEIIADFSIVSEVVGYTTQVESKLKIIEVKEKSSCIEVVTRSVNEPMFFEIVFVFYNDSPTFNLHYKIKMIGDKVSVKIERLTLVLIPRGNTSGICQRNGQYINKNFEKYYWLGKNGFKFGRGSSCIGGMLCNNISSVQIDIDRELAFLNFDYFKDHPQIINDQDGPSYKDVSHSNFSHFSKLSGVVSLFTGGDPDNIALMRYPDARVSCHILTEHGCFNDKKVIEAIYYGISPRNQKLKADSGALLNKNLSVTKSIFLTNETKVSNNTYGDCNLSFFAFGEKDNVNLIKELSKSDIEIALHCVDHSEISLNHARDSILNINSVIGKQVKTFIDHIWYKPGGHKSGPIVACYNGDAIINDWGRLYEKLGIRYFWSAAIEYIWVKDMIYQDEASAFNFYAYPSSLPTPVYSFSRNLNQDNTKVSDDRFVQWYTPRSWMPNIHSIHDDIRKIRPSVLNWGFYVNHCYLSFAGDSNCSVYKKNDNAYISSEFKFFISELSELIEQGNLWMPTVERFLDYNLKVDEVELLFLGRDDGGAKYTLSNKSTTKIYGLSLCIGSNLEFSAQSSYKTLVKFNKLFIVLDLESFCSLDFIITSKK